MTSAPTGEPPAVDAVLGLESCGVVVDGRDLPATPRAHRIVTLAVDVALLLLASVVALGGLVGISRNGSEGLPVPSTAMTAAGGALMAVGILVLCVATTIGVRRADTRRGPYWIAAATLFGAGFLTWIVG